MSEKPRYRLACGAYVYAEDVGPCPDPYCRTCRDWTGEVIDPPIEEVKP